MGLYLQIDADDGEPLASLSGWGDFAEWVQGLPAAESGQLRHLCEYGWSQEVSALARELAEMLADHQPGEADVRKTAADLRGTLTKAKGAEVISVTDGLGA